MMDERGGVRLRLGECWSAVLEPKIHTTTLHTYVQVARDTNKRVHYLQSKPAARSRMRDKRREVAQRCMIRGQGRGKRQRQDLWYDYSLPCAVPGAGLAAGLLNPALSPAETSVSGLKTYCRDPWRRGSSRTRRTLAVRAATGRHSRAAGTRGRARGR